VGGGALCALGMTGSRAGLQGSLLRGRGGYGAGGGGAHLRLPPFPCRRRVAERAARRRPVRHGRHAGGVEAH
jgi:hypothetical protein